MPLLIRTFHWSVSGDRERRSTVQSGLCVARSPLSLPSALPPPPLSLDTAPTNPASLPLQSAVPSRGSFLGRSTGPPSMYCRHLCPHHPLPHTLLRLSTPHQIPRRPSTTLAHSRSALPSQCPRPHRLFAPPRCPPSSFHLPLCHLFGFSAPKPVTQTIRRRVPFSPSTFYSVILDVPSYHLFLPFCVASTLNPGSPPPTPNAPSTFTATLTVGFRVFTESYTSRITSTPPHTITVQAISSSIFDHLNSTWVFSPVASSPSECDVAFTIDFLVTSRMHAGAVQMFFGDVTEQQMKAFIKRCQEVEGQRVKEVGRVGAGDRARATNEVKQPLASAATKPAAIDMTPVQGMAVPPACPPQAQPKRSPPVPASLPPRPQAPQAPALTAQGTRKPLYSPSVRFTEREIQQLRSVFRDYASGKGQKPGAPGPTPASADTAPTLSQMTEEHTQQPQRPSPAQSTSPSASPHPQLRGDEYINEVVEASNPSSTPLTLSFPAFSHLCAFLSLPTAGVFSKYRERASLRACGEDESIALACFASQPSLHRYSGSGLEGENASPAFTHSHPLSSKTHHPSTRSWAPPSYHQPFLW